MYGDPDPNNLEPFVKLLVPTAAVLWTSASTLLAVAKELNSIRDRVILGTLDGRPLSVAHRRHLMQCDWRPILLCALALSLFYTLLMVLGAYMVMNGIIPSASGISIGFYAASAFYLTATCAWAFTARDDWRIMDTAIGTSDTSPPAAIPSLPEGPAKSELPQT